MFASGGVDALSACCACGGGSEGARRKHGVKCRNFPLKWADIEGHGCSEYVDKSWCTPNGGYAEQWGDSSVTFEDFAKDGFDAALACCGCGGGLYSLLNPSTASRTDTINTTAVTQPSTSLAPSPENKSGVREVNNFANQNTVLPSNPDRIAPESKSAVSTKMVIFALLLLLSCCVLVTVVYMVAKRNRNDKEQATALSAFVGEEWDNFEFQKSTLFTPALCAYITYMLGHPFF